MLKVSNKDTRKMSMTYNEKVEIGRMFEIITQQAIICSKSIEAGAYKKCIES